MGKRILIVEDTKTIVMVEKMMLAGQGFEVHIAGDGVEGLEKVKVVEPDLILLDVMMPRMNGIEMCKRLRENEATASLPVIMVTTLGEPEQVEEAYLAGCTDYLTKPLDKLELVEKINKYI